LNWNHFDRPRGIPRGQAGVSQIGHNEKFSREIPGTPFYGGVALTVGDLVVRKQADITMHKD
jgi:hypothetical protein